MNSDPLETLFGLLARSGAQSYHGEPVSQLEHALQAAAFAQRAGASAALVVAALFHDVGHLAHDEGEGAAERGVDTAHESQGAELLRACFGPEIVEPVRLHVSAKRYLCAIDPAYEAALSPASRLSLPLQGGPMSADEVRAFQDHPQHQDALRLRHWDDAAKVRGLAVPALDQYRELARRVARAPGRGEARS